LIPLWIRTRYYLEFTRSHSNTRTLLQNRNTYYYQIK